MKKLLFTMLMAVSTIAVAMAQNPTPQVISKPNQTCGTEIILLATPEDHYSFSEWQMKNGETIIEHFVHNQVITNGSCITAADNNGKLSNTLTLTLDGAMMSAATSGTLTFEAFFTEDNKFTITVGYLDGQDNTFGTLSTSDPNEVYAGETVTVKALADPCYEVDYWVDENGTQISSTRSVALNDNSGKTRYELDVTADANWDQGSTHVYKPHFTAKKVTLEVRTADSSKGVVTMIRPQ